MGQKVAWNWSDVFVTVCYAWFTLDRGNMSTPCNRVNWPPVQPQKLKSLSPFVHPPSVLVSHSVPLQGVGTLQEVQVPIISQTSCQEMYQTRPTDTVDILYDMICAGYQEGGKDSCQVLLHHLLVLLCLLEQLHAKQEDALKITWIIRFLHLDTSQWWKLSLCVLWRSSVCFFPGWLRRASCLQDGERDLGPGWGGEFWTGLCSSKPARRLHQVDELLKLHQEHNTRDQAVRPRWSEPMPWCRCAGQLSVCSAGPALEINHGENWR